TGLRLKVGTRIHRVINTSIPSKNRVQDINTCKRMIFEASSVTANTTGEVECMGSPIVVMGVSGSGKSTVGAALAQRLRVPFGDADDFHPPANVAKMTAGHPLDDDDRYPWLETIGQWLVDHQEGGVMSCSA